MSERETPQTIHDSAVAWIARLDRSGDDPQARAELDIWLAADERRQGAFFRAQAAWAMLDRASVLRGGYQDEQKEDLEDIDRGVWLSRRRMLWGGGMTAASVALVVAGAGLWPQSPERIETALGEIRRVPLNDGSIASVNTQTKLTVSFKPEIRQVALDEGEAWFQVAKDRTRPFVVEAGDVRVRAVGTAFSVRRTGQGIEVQVTEGVVEVWSVGDEPNMRLVSAGARTFVNDATGSAPAPAVEAGVEIDRALSWRNGQLIFDGDTVGQAAAEFNRYNKIKIEVAVPSLAKEKIIGRFRTNEPDAFARAAAGILGARAEIGPDKIVLSRN